MELLTFDYSFRRKKLFLFGPIPASQLRHDDFFFSGFLDAFLTRDVAEGIP